MNIKWNEVTWYSKLLSAIFLLLVVPILTFYIGTQYQAAKMIPIAQNEIYYKTFVSKNYGISFEYPADWHVVEHPVPKDNGVHDSQLIELYAPADYANWQKCLADDPKDSHFLCSALSARSSIVFYYSQYRTCDSLSGTDLSNFPACVPRKFGFTYRQSSYPDYENLGEEIYFQINNPDKSVAFKLIQNGSVIPNQDQDIASHIAETVLFPKQDSKKPSLVR